MAAILLLGSSLLTPFDLWSRTVDESCLAKESLEGEKYHDKKDYHDDMCRMWGLFSEGTIHASEHRRRSIDQSCLEKEVRIRKDIKGWCIKLNTIYI